jgi:hypothetical protein
VLASAGVSTALFTLTLAASDGVSAVLAPVVHPTEYWGNLATLPPASTMLHRYGTIDFLLDYSVHAKGHPPGFLLLLKGLAAIGLGKPWVAGALSYVGAAAVPVMVLVVMRSMAGETMARRAAPFFVTAPYALWMGTSADAFYTAVTASGIAALVVAWQRSQRSTRARHLGAAGGGGLLGLGLFCSYGVVPLLALPGVLVARSSLVSWRATLTRTASAVAAAAAVTGAFALAGFWWFDGLRVTKTLYWWGTAQYRPWKYFTLGNIGASMLAVGPAVVVGIGALRSRALWWIIGGTLACVAIANLSQYSKGEVERIWLLFFPWLVPATAALRPVRVWLGAQAIFTIVLQTWLVSKW